MWGLNVYLTLSCTQLDFEDEEEEEEDEGSIQQEHDEDSDDVDEAFEDALENLKIKDVEPAPHSIAVAA